MSDDFAFQATICTPPSAQYAKGHMVNVRANTPEELAQRLNAVADSAVAEAFARAVGVIAASEAVAPLAAPAPAPVTPVAPTQPTQAPQAPVAPAGAQAGAPSCHHGVKKFISKPATATKKAWSAWGCPAPQGTPDACGLDFIR